MTTITNCPSHTEQRLCPPGCCHICDRLRGKLVPVTEQEAEAAHWFYAVYFINEDFMLCWALPRHPLPMVEPLFMATAAVEVGTPVKGQMEITL